MTKALAKGAAFPATEAARLVRMIEGGSLRAEKVKEFRYRVNALRVFDASIPKPPAAVKPNDEEEAGADEGEGDPSADDESVSEL